MAKRITIYPNLESTRYKSNQWTSVELHIEKYARYAITGYSICSTDPSDHIVQFSISISKSYKNDNTFFCHVYNHFAGDLTTVLQLAINLIYIVKEE